MDDQAVWRRGAPVRFPSARWELTFSRAPGGRENGGRLELALPYSPARPWRSRSCSASRAWRRSAENPTSSTPLTEGRPLYFEKTENYVYHFTKDCATNTRNPAKTKKMSGEP